MTSAADLARENEELRHQLREAEELIAAVRTGAVDALAIQGADGPRIFTLEGADHTYRTLIEQMNEGALLLSPEGTVLYCNAALARLLACPLEEVMGGEMMSFVPGSHWKYWVALLGRGWAGTARGELPLQSRDGGLHPTSLSMNVLHFSGSRSLVVLVTDLSAQQEIADTRTLVQQQNALLAATNEELVHQQAERKAAERAATETSRVLEGIPQIAWAATPQGSIFYLNRRWLDFAGPDDIAYPLKLRTRLHPDDAAEVLRRWEHSLTTQQPLEMECRLHNAAGDYRWMLGRALPAYDEQGELTRWIGTYTDIHEHKLTLENLDQTQQQLRDNNTQLSRVNADLDNFVYAASHDLKQPVNNIEGLLHALREDLSPDHAASVDGILRMMSTSVERFRRTVEQLTDVSRLQYEQATGVAVSLPPVVQAVQLDLAPVLLEAAAQLTIEVADNLAVSVLEKNLRSIVYNLLSNALKYRHSERAPTIGLQATLEAGFVRLSVQDNGLGLDAASQKKLFGMFQRLHNHVEGSGIGLYMVKKMVENAGGRVEVTSELGIGSTFVVYLPL
ncbi:MAG: ATP-binding protein [Janthinobacterium lividum]